MKSFWCLYECVPLAIFYHLYFLHISKVSSMLYHHGSVGQVHSKECYFIFTCTFLTFFCCFSSKNLCSYQFHFFFDEVSNFGSRILTNQKPEQVIKNCQWNCMLLLTSNVVHSLLQYFFANLEQVTFFMAMFL